MFFNNLSVTVRTLCMCEMADIDPSVASAGYGAAYLFGVIGVVLFVQAFLPKKLPPEKTISDGNQNGDMDGLFFIAAAAVGGTVLGGFKIPIFNHSAGIAGGILIAGIVCGMAVRKFPRFKNGLQHLSVYRNLGLMLFFVGNGISAGENLTMLSDIKWFAYR